MPESETSKKITRVVKLADGLAQDLKRGVEKLLEAVRELRESGKDDEEEKGE